MEQKTILVIEDEAAIRKALASLLSSAGYVVMEATNGEEGKAMALAKQPNLVVLDIMMPKMHGFDVVKALDADPWGKNVPIVVVSNYTDDPRVADLVKRPRTIVKDKAGLSKSALVEEIQRLLKG